MDGALTFTHVCVDSSRTVLEHHTTNYVHKEDNNIVFTVYWYTVEILHKDPPENQMTPRDTSHGPSYTEKYTSGGHLS